MDHRAIVGWLALAASLALAALLQSMEWIDAYVTARMAGLRGCSAATFVTALTDVAPYGAAVVVAVGGWVAWRRGTPPRRLARFLGGLLVALLLAQGAKTTFQRDRPGVSPWSASSSQSFPSGHTANAALAVAAALAVTRDRAARRKRGVRAMVTVAGCAFVLMVGFTRLYLNRHWATDVLAGALAGIAFWGIATARPSAIRRGFLVVVVIALPGLLAAGPMGWRIPLPAPSTLSDRDMDGTELLHHARLSHTADSTWTGSPRHGDRGFVRLNRPTLEMSVRAHRARRAVLKVIASPLAALRHDLCPWIEVRVNEEIAGRRPLKRQWRVYAFALPLAPGRNDVRLSVGEATAGGPVLALNALSVDATSASLSFAVPAVAVAGLARPAGRREAGAATFGGWWDACGGHPRDDHSETREEGVHRAFCRCVPGIDTRCVAGMPATGNT